MPDRLYNVKIFSIWLSVILCNLLFAQDVNAATNCEQELVLLGKTQNKNGNPMIWITDNVSGECLYTRIVRLELLKNSVTDSSELVGYKNWQEIGERISNAHTTGQVEFKKIEDSLWSFENKRKRITIPQPDSLVLSEYKRWDLSTSEIPEWNKKNGARAIMVPEIEDIQTKLIYAYPRGIYINYSIDRVYYFPEKNYFYLLIFTKQPKLAAGYDSMHGFLLLKGKYK